MSIKDGLMSMAGIFIISTAMFGCGSVGGTGSSEGGTAGLLSGNGTTAGKVGILLKDAPLADTSSISTDSPEISELWVTVNRVSLKMDSEMEDDGWLTVFEGTARYDLLSLQDNNSALMALAPVTAEFSGNYEKARLEISEIPGTNCFYSIPGGTADDPLNPCTDSDAHLLNVPSGKIDINFHPSIYLGPDTTQYIVFNLLPAESVKITDTNGVKGYLLRPVVHAYTMPSVLQDNGWDYIRVDELEGHIAEIMGCDNPDLPDTLILSPDHGGVDISIDITGTSIYLHDSDIPAACSSLQPGQELEVKFRISGDGTMTVDRIEIEDSFDKDHDMDDDLTGELISPL